ncbi:MAG: biotin-dependent carboxyltransferase family protein [Eubacterium sp.]
MGIKIINAGALSTVQDLGRFKVMKNGFTQSGAMDLRSARLANRLVNNEDGCAVVEMTLMGMTVEFDREYIIAVTGADVTPHINGNAVKMNKAYRVKKSDTLKMSVAKSGCRAYLAVSGGIAVPYFMNSFSTNLKSEIGGFNGRRLQNGDVLEVFEWDVSSLDIKNAFVKPEVYSGDITVRAVLGPQDFMFTADDIKSFFTQKYTVTAQADRMGIRLDGAPLKSKNGFDIISDGIVFGSVQVPESGMPIILMADHQTTGGYAKIATVISVDLPLLAQAKPNDTVKFEQISVANAEKLAKKESRLFERLKLY